MPPVTPPAYVPFFQSDLPRLWNSHETFRFYNRLRFGSNLWFYSPFRWYIQRPKRPFLWGQNFWHNRVWLSASPGTLHVPFVFFRCPALQCSDWQMNWIDRLPHQGHSRARMPWTIWRNNSPPSLRSISPHSFLSAPVPGCLELLCFLYICRVAIGLCHAGTIDCTKYSCFRCVDRIAAHLLLLPTKCLAIMSKRSSSKNTFRRDASSISFGDGGFGSSTIVFACYFLLQIDFPVLTIRNGTWMNW